MLAVALAAAAFTPVRQRSMTFEMLSTRSCSLQKPEDGSPACLRRESCQKDSPEFLPSCEVSIGVAACRMLLNLK